MLGWGYGVYIGTTTNAIAISASYSHTLALHGDGTLTAWGSNTHGESTIPAGLNNVKAISGGTGHSVALKGDGTLQAWGSNTDQQSTVPANLTGVIAMDGWAYQNLALVVGYPVHIFLPLIEH